MRNVYDIKMAQAGDEQPNLDAPRHAFDDFWQLYPRRVAKKDAEKAWKAVPREAYPLIFAALPKQRQTDDWRRDSGKFIPYPASYLRGERWTDELQADLTMGECMWNINGNREDGPKCSKPGTTEKNGAIYCAGHANRVNG